MEKNMVLLKPLKQQSESYFCKYQEAKSLTASCLPIGIDSHQLSEIISQGETLAQHTWEFTKQSTSLFKTFLCAPGEQNETKPLKLIFTLLIT